MAALAAPTFDNPVTRINGEKLIYINRNPGRIVKFLGYMDSNVVETAPLHHPTSGADGICAGKLCPAGSWNATVNMGDGPTGLGAYSENPPIGHAEIGDVDPAHVDDFWARVCLPNTEHDVLVCFDGAVEATEEMRLRKVPRKFDAHNHTVIQRASGTLNLNEILISDKVGFRRILGRPATVIVKIFPKGLNAYTEVHYFCGVTIQPKFSMGEDDNADARQSYTGNFDFHAAFTHS